MKALLAALAVSLLALPVHAQEKKEPSAAQKKQQERMASCNKQAGSKGMKGDDRKKFMSDCLKDPGPSAAQKKQQDRMASCNKQAGSKGMKGDDRKKFMSDCLKG